MKNGKKILLFIISILVILLAVVNVFLYLHVTSPMQQVGKQLDLGQQYLLNLEYEEAVAAFEIVIEIEPKNVDAYMGMAEAYIGMGKTDKAIQILKRGYRETGDEDLGDLLEQLEAEQNREKADVRIVQIDTGEFPNIAVYFSVEDEDGNFIEDVQPRQVQVLEEYTNEWVAQEGNLQLSGQESVSKRSVAMVVDVSGSMEGSLEQLCDAAQELLNQMQGGGYYVSLTAFDNTWNTLVDYTDNLSTVSASLDGLYAGGGTALYDTLENSLYEAVNQQGQKYILAFTDGADGSSSITKDELISLANYYHIPIYIIAALGQGYEQDMEEIARESGGAFYAISSINDLYNIYFEIFQMQEKLYTFRYTTKQSNTECGLRVVYNSDRSDGEAENSFISQKPIRRERVGNQMISSVRASSQTEENPVENAFDSREATMWTEGVWGNGIGETIEITLDADHKVNGLTIYNGNRASHDLYEKYGRVKTIQVTFSDGSQRQYEIADNFYTSSQVNFINPIQTDTLKIEILEVYEGTTYQDTCIADININ